MKLPSIYTLSPGGSQQPRIWSMMEILHDPIFVVCYSFGVLVSKLMQDLYYHPQQGGAQPFGKSGSGNWRHTVRTAHTWRFMRL